MSKIATYNNYYRNNESILKSKSFATTSISSIYHLNSQSPTLEEILLNEAMDSETKTIKETIAEKSCNPSFVKPTNKFGFSSFAMPKRLIDNRQEEHFKHDANSNEKLCLTQKSEIGGTISIVESYPTKTIKNHDEINNPNKIVRPNTAMSIQDLTYNSRLAKPLNESGDNQKSFLMARSAGVIVNTDKFGFNQNTNAVENKSDFNPTKTISINQSNSYKNSSKLARPNTAMNGKTFDYNSHIRSPKAEENKDSNKEKNDNFSYYLKGDTAMSTLKINKQTFGVGVQNNNNKDAFGYNKKIKAIAKDLLTFIKEEKILKDTQAEEKCEKEAFKFSNNNMSKTIVESHDQNSFDSKNQGYLSHSTFPISYKNQATRTTYETLPTPITKESIQKVQSLPQSHPIEVPNSKFGFKAKPFPSIIKQSPQTAQLPSIKTKTFVETSSYANKGLEANDLEEINSSKKNFYNPYTRTIYETSVYSNNNDVSKINQTVFTKQTFPLYSGNKPVSIDSESSNTSNNSLENFDCNASVRNFLEENVFNDGGLKKETSYLNLNKTQIDSMHQYLPNKQTESIFETQFKQMLPSSFNTKTDTNIEKQINDVEKMVLIKGAMTMKSQNNSELGLNFSKSLRNPEGNSYYFIEETPHKNEIAPLKTVTKNIYSPKIDSFNNYAVKETELNFQTTNNELDFKLEKLTEKVDKLIQKGSIQHQSEKIESLPKKYQLPTKPAMKLLTNLPSSTKINKNLPTLNSISKQSRTILETSKKNDESVKTVKKSFLSPSLSSKIGGRAGETNVLKGNIFEQSSKNKLETKDVPLRHSKPSISSKTIIEKPLINKTSTQIKEPLKKNSNTPTKSILEKPIIQKIAHTSNIPTRTLNESYSKNLTSKLKPTQTQSKVFPERKTSFGYSKPDSFERSLTIMDSNQKKISELENSIKKSFLQSSLTNKKVKSEKNPMSSKGSISNLPTQSFLESSNYSRSLTASKDFSNKIKQTFPSRTILEKTASKNQFTPQSKPNESIYDIRNSYMPTKSIIEKPKAYSTKPLSAPLKQKENNIFSSVQKAEQSMPSKTITERRSSFGFNKGQETKVANLGLKSSEILIDQIVISLEKHEKEQQKRSQLVSHLGIRKGPETYINNYGDFSNSNDCDENLSDTLKNTEESNHSQSQKNIIKLAKKDVKSVEDKKENYLQNFKPKAMAIRSLEQKENNTNTGNQGLKSSIFFSKNLQQKQPVADRKQTNQKAKQTQKNTKQSGYLSCRSRTFSNLDVVLEVEREEYSRCSDDSKSTIKTWSIATTANDQEKSFSSFEDVKKLTKEENSFLSDETKRDEDTSELIRESVKSSNSLDPRTESNTRHACSLDSVEKTMTPEKDEINDSKSESNIELTQPDVKKEIETFKEDSIKNKLCSEQGIYNLNLIDEIFKYIEKGSEKVSVEQVLVIFEKLNPNFKNEPLFVNNGEMEIFVRKLDTNSDGFIDLKELLLVCDQFENF